MQSLAPGPELIGRKVINPVRPEWGIGQVLRVSATEEAGAPVHRVSVQFPTGHRTLVMPPAKLCDPQPEIQRQTGWLDELGKNTLDAKLRGLPEDVLFFLGSPEKRVIAAAAMYEWEESQAGLARWARKQTMTSDPLALWSRDELQAAFDDYCSKRDQWLREAAAIWRKHHPRASAERLLEDIDPGVRRRMVSIIG